LPRHGGADANRPKRVGSDREWNPIEVRKGWRQTVMTRSCVITNSTDSARYRAIRFALIRKTTGLGFRSFELQQFAGFVFAAAEHVLHNDTILGSLKYFLGRRGLRLR
jgi:hypothetical protein